MILQTIAYWTLPPGFYDPILKFGFKLSHMKYLSMLKRNIRFKDLHKGKRCFILCNGPSVNQQNLLPLKDEIVFSVSSGYHHQDYHIFHPKYHCIPQITYTSLFTKDTTIAWFKEMDEKVGDAELFLNISEESLVRENNLFKDRKINYVCMNGKFDDKQSKIIDITGIIPGIQSVPIMCLMIAMYMGFKEIYLIGVEHDSFRTREYKYFYTPTMLAGKDHAVCIDGRIKCSLYDEFHAYAYLWEQYRILKYIAFANNISICNATCGGALDEFERVSLDKVL